MTDETLILGASGFLGSYFARAMGQRAVHHSTSRLYLPNSSQNDTVISRLDSESDIESVLNGDRFSRVINCVALANIDECEANPEKAHWVNSEIPRILAEKSSERNINLVHISTDAIFDGKGGPYTEVASANPISVYGKTKFLGEEMVRNSNPGAYIFRVNFFGMKSRGNSLFNFFFNAIQDKKQVMGFDDVLFTTMYAQHTAELALEILEKCESGIYNLVGSETLSKYDFGVMVGAEFGLPPEWLLRGSVDSSTGGNLRSKNLCLDNSKILRYGLKPPSIGDGIRNLVSELTR